MCQVCPGQGRLSLIIILLSSFLIFTYSMSLILYLSIHFFYDRCIQQQSNAHTHSATIVIFIITSSLLLSLFLLAFWWCCCLEKMLVVQFHDISDPLEQCTHRLLPAVNPSPYFPFTVSTTNSLSVLHYMKTIVTPYIRNSNPSSCLTRHIVS